jgi:glycosyltransferase involved in cell wall biosynthesis
MTKLTIITPTFNSANVVGKNIESVISQNFHDFEHVIIDNLSSDGTLEIITNLYQKAGKENQLKIFSEKDSGISDAFNKGVARSKNDVIGILNSDDYFFDSNVLSDIIREFETDSNLQFIHGNMIFEDNSYGTNLRRPLQCPIEYAMPFNHPTMFVRKEVYNKVGTYNLNYRYCMDFDLICRILQKKLSGKYLDRTITFMRAGGESDKHEEKALKEFGQILSKYPHDSRLAQKFSREKLARIRLKNLASKMNLGILIKIWRKFKWSLN